MMVKQNSKTTSSWQDLPLDPFISINKHLDSMNLPPNRGCAWEELATIPEQCTFVPLDIFFVFHIKYHKKLQPGLPPEFDSEWFNLRRSDFSGVQLSGTRKSLTGTQSSFSNLQ